MSAPRVLIVVLALDAEPWRTIEATGQRGTWAAAPAVPVLWLKGNTTGPVRWLTRVAIRVTPQRFKPRIYGSLGRYFSTRRVLETESTLQTSVPETYLMTNAKTVAAFRYLLERCDFDYVLRTNSSTYVNIDRLLEVAQTAPREGFLSGMTWTKDGLEYVTGTSMLMSRDVMRTAVDDPAWEFDLIDDFAFGRAMNRAGIPIRRMPTVDACTDDQLARLTPDALEQTMTVRCRGISDRSHDVRAMRKVHEMLRQVSDRE